MLERWLLSAWWCSFDVQVHLTWGRAGGLLCGVLGYGQLVEMLLEALVERLVGRGCLACCLVATWKVLG